MSQFEKMLGVILFLLVALHVDTHALLLYDYREPLEPRDLDAADVRQLQLLRAG